MTIYNASSLFAEVYAETETFVAYDKEWENGTGYFDGAVGADLGLRPGEMSTAVDPHGRRLILVGTRFGNVVVFERYTPGKDETRTDTLVSNVPRKVTQFFAGASVLDHKLDTPAMELLIGNKYAPNFGKRIEILLK